MLILPCGTAVLTNQWAATQLVYPTLALPARGQLEPIVLIRIPSFPSLFQFHNDIA